MLKCSNAHRYLKTSHFLKGITQRMSIKYCGKIFNRGSNYVITRKSTAHTGIREKCLIQTHTVRIYRVKIMFRQVPPMNLNFWCQQKGMLSLKCKLILGYHTRVYRKRRLWSAGSYGSSCWEGKFFMNRLLKEYIFTETVNDEDD